MHLRHPIFTAILSGGCVAGTLDVGMAALIYQLNPVIILHAIASGVLGKPAFQGGTGVAVLGLALQWVMSWLIAAIYVFAAQRIGWLNRWWVAAGVSYGIAVFVVMNYIVRPLSAAWPPTDFHFHAERFFENLAAMLVFGLIISYFARIFSNLAPSRESAKLD
ncbi:MAG TPA: hypothetical protein VFK12_01590 [Gammaproteobacteria bacterium]|nr:hypothetical protein [Gammaproteobacteria bacterium]